jgi:hypothetical protein
MEYLTESDLAEIVKVIEAQKLKAWQAQACADEKLAKLNGTGLNLFVTAAQLIYTDSNRAKPGGAQAKKARLGSLERRLEHLLAEGTLNFVDYVLCSR